MANKHVVIIGNGVAGITCARNIRKQSDFKITVISAETAHHFSRTALMYIYMGHLRYKDTKPYEDGFWIKNKISLLFKQVVQVETDIKTLHFFSGEKLEYDILIIATGSKPNNLRCPGNHFKGVQGLYSINDLQLLERNTKNIKKAVIVGGGLIGVELAEMLHSKKIEVTFLIREKHFWGSVLPQQEAELIERHLKQHHINLKFETQVSEIIADENGNVTHISTNLGETIDCQFVGVTIGVSPNILFLANSAIKTDKGILVNQFFETNLKDVYAIGDCAQFNSSINNRRTIEQVWYTGKMHGETLARTITKSKTTYNPGPWFNSAKFFNIEYQTYGNVPNIISNHLNSFYWEHKSGIVCLRIVFEAETQTLIGINVFGIRMRHQVFNNWLMEGKKVNYVMQHLAEANFDPEFFVRYENEINLQFKKEFALL